MTEIIDPGLRNRFEPETAAAPSAPAAAQQGRRVRRFSADLSAVGEPALWAFGGALALGIILIAGFLFMVAWNGIATFWPKPIAQVELRDGTLLAGEPTRGNRYRPGENVLATLDEGARAFVEENGGYSDRVLYKTANYDLYVVDLEGGKKVKRFILTSG